ncbi:hypothetical protein [Thauera linaloolentis]|uniref:hypothetical protein n=1 Tax=Thauera linaloolentis TaxID=76112 RepID=UPI0002D6280F|nr:hypothetical protein [Thauera linaloolentis]MCM8564431.1 hypothetical protein [Thauera linaloolentis]
MEAPQGEQSHADGVVDGAGLWLLHSCRAQKQGPGYVHVGISCCRIGKRETPQAPREDSYRLTRKKGKTAVFFAAGASFQRRVSVPGSGYGTWHGREALFEHGQDVVAAIGPARMRLLIIDGFVIVHLETRLFQEESGRGAGYGPCWTDGLFRPVGGVFSADKG